NFTPPPGNDGGASALALPHEVSGLEPRVGGELLTPAIAALAPGGRLVAYSSGGGTIQAYDLLVGARSVIGFQMARIARGQPELYELWRQELWRLFGDGLVRPAVHAEFALEDAAKAHEAIESRANLGKVVLRP
ncbi:zinc-binding dehydrogenase, partial [Streptomyces carpinensis]